MLRSSNLVRRVLPEIMSAAMLGLALVGAFVQSVAGQDDVLVEEPDTIVGRDVAETVGDDVDNIVPQNADTLRLSLSQCLGRALDEGEEWALAESDLSRAHARYAIARAVLLPRIEVNSSYTKQLESIYEGSTDVPAFEPDTTASLEDRVRELEDALPDAGFTGLAALFENSSFASPHAWDFTLSASQKIFQGGLLVNSILAARHALRGANDIRSDARAGIELAVRQAYLTALWADREYEITELGLRQAESQLSRVQLREEAGQVSEFERLRAELQRDNQLPLLQWAENQREVAYLDLRRLVNLPAQVPLALTTRLLDERALPLADTGIDTTGWVASAFETPGLRGLEQVAESRKHAVKIAGSERWPELSAFASLSQQAYPKDLWPTSGDWRRDARAGLTVRWNVFDGLETKGVIQEAKSNQIDAERQLVQARESVRQAVVQQRGELLRAAADLRARTRTVEVARRAYSLAQLRYEEGASGLIELEETRRDAQIAESNEARARYDFFLALAQLERYTGRALFPDSAEEGESR